MTMGNTFTHYALGFNVTDLDTYVHILAEVSLDDSHHYLPGHTISLLAFGATLKSAINTIVWQNSPDNQNNAVVMMEIFEPERRFG